jgi:hypothetical protein
VIQHAVTSRGTYIFLAGLDSSGDLEFLGQGLIFCCINLIFFEDGKWLFDVEFLDSDLAGVHCQRVGWRRKVGSVRWGSDRPKSHQTWVFSAKKIDHAMD